MESEHRTGILRYWPQKWYWRVLLIVAFVYVLMNLLLLTAGTDSAGAATPEQLQSNLDTAIVVNSNVVDPSILSTPPSALAAIPAKCNRFPVWRMQSLQTRIGHVTMAWRRTRIDKWCNNTRGVITNWGAANGDDGKWTGPGYCWYDVTFGKVWNTVSQTEGKVWNQGTLKVCGRLSLGHSVNPRIFFHGATTSRRYAYWNYGGTTIYH